MRRAARCWRRCTSSRSRCRCRSTRACRRTACATPSGCLRGRGGGVRRRRGGRHGARPLGRQAIVSEAKRRGVEAIVLGAEEPSACAAAGHPRRARAGARPLRGGDHPLRRGEGALQGDPDRRRPARRARGRASCRSPFSRPPGCIVGWMVRSDRWLRARGVRNRQLNDGRGARGVRARRGRRGHRAAGSRAGAQLGGARRPVHRGHRPSRSTPCWRRASSADAFVASTDGDNTNLVIAQVAKRRFDIDRVVVRVLDPARARWYAEQGLQTVCPTQTAIELLEAAVRGQIRFEGVAGQPMYVVIVGAGKVGWNLARELINKRHEVTVIEADAHRYAVVGRSSSTARCTATARVLERAGMERADLVVAVTGDDEDNILICRSREKYGVARGGALQQPAQPPALRAARRAAGDLRDRPDPSPDRARGAEVRPGPPLDLPEERLEIIELEVGDGSPASAGRSRTRAARRLAAASRSCARAAVVPTGDSVIEPGDEVLVVLDVGIESRVTELFTARTAA